MNSLLMNALKWIIGDMNKFSLRKWIKEIFSNLKNIAQNHQNNLILALDHSFKVLLVL